MPIPEEEMAGLSGGMAVCASTPLQEEFVGGEVGLALWEQVGRAPSPGPLSSCRTTELLELPVGPGRFGPHLFVGREPARVSWWHLVTLSTTLGPHTWSAKPSQVRGYGVQGRIQRCLVVQVR